MKCEYEILDRLFFAGTEKSLSTKIWMGERERERERGQNADKSCKWSSVVCSSQLST